MHLPTTTIAENHMKNIPHQIPALTDKQARDLGRRIVTDSKSVRVKFGKTNGRNVLHVFVPGTSVSRTIQTLGQWESHPANVKTARKHKEEEPKNG